MAEVRIIAERTITAPAAEVYRLVADYREHHPRFLPPAFSEWQVEQGGIGAGTIVRFRLKAAGRNQLYRQQVTEPQPGRVLQEAGIDGGPTTTFTVTPDGPHCRVQIVTAWQANPITAFVQRRLAPRALGPLYAEELARLEQYAHAQDTG